MTRKSDRKNKQVAHVDLKPGNVFYGGGDASADFDASNANRVVLLHTAGFKITPASPEQQAAFEAETRRLRDDIAARRIRFRLGSQVFGTLRMRPAPRKLRTGRIVSAVDLIPGPKTRKLVTKMVADQVAHIDSLETANRPLAARWQLCWTWVLLVWYAVLHAASGLFKAVRGKLAG